jgi:type I restriction enzyme S subunit
MMRMWHGTVGVAPVDGLISPAYIVAKPLPETDSRYYGYLFRIGAYRAAFRDCRQRAEAR